MNTTNANDCNYRFLVPGEGGGGEFPSRRQRKEGPLMTCCTYRKFKGIQNKIESREFLMSFINIEITYIVSKWIKFISRSVTYRRNRDPFVGKNFWKDGSGTGTGTGTSTGTWAPDMRLPETTRPKGNLLPINIEKRSDTSNLIGKWRKKNVTRSIGFLIDSIDWEIN